jgi:hypothetical protein
VIPRRSLVAAGLAGAALAYAACSSPSSLTAPALSPRRADASASTSSPTEDAPGADGERERAPSAAHEDAPTACRTDAECGYDPTSSRCGSDPRYNRQPPLVDQGIVCYCDEPAQTCAMLRVPPVPCEGNHACAVRNDPRPHPVRASKAYPHERGRPCFDFKIKTTCERTNICTMHRLKCK